MTFTVADNGVGMADTVGSGGNGLRNLAQRAHQLDGTMTMTAGEPTGTVLTWTVPT
jgi:two-component system sensor histidine kinase DevS